MRMANGQLADSQKTLLVCVRVSVGTTVGIK